MCGMVRESLGGFIARHAENARHLLERRVGQKRHIFSLRIWIDVFGPPLILLILGRRCGSGAAECAAPLGAESGPETAYIFLTHLI